MLQLQVVLYDSGDGEAFPLEGECVDSDVIVRKPLYKVQHKHWSQSRQNTMQKSGYLDQKVYPVVGLSQSLQLLLIQRYVFYYNHTLYLIVGSGVVPMEDDIILCHPNITREHKKPLLFAYS